MIMTRLIWFFWRPIEHYTACVHGLWISMSSLETLERWSAFFLLKQLFWDICIVCAYITFGCVIELILKSIELFEYSLNQSNLYAWNRTQRRPELLLIIPLLLPLYLPVSIHLWSYLSSDWLHFVPLWHSASRDEESMSENNSQISADLKTNIEELEMLLEAYFVQIDGVSQKLANVWFSLLPPNPILLIAMMDVFTSESDILTNFIEHIFLLGTLMSCIFWQCTIYQCIWYI